MRSMGGSYSRKWMRAGAPGGALRRRRAMGAPSEARHCRGPPKARPPRRSRPRASRAPGRVRSSSPPGPWPTPRPTARTADAGLAGAGFSPSRSLFRPRTVRRRHSSLRERSQGFPPAAARLGRLRAVRGVALDPRGDRLHVRRQLAGVQDGRLELRLVEVRPAREREEEDGVHGVAQPARGEYYARQKFRRSRRSLPHGSRSRGDTGAGPHQYSGLIGCMDRRNDAGRTIATKPIVKLKM